MRGWGGLEMRIAGANGGVDGAGFFGVEGEEIAGKAQARVVEGVETALGEGILRAQEGLAVGEQIEHDAHQTLGLAGTDRTIGKAAIDGIGVWATNKAGIGFEQAVKQLVVLAAGHGFIPRADGAQRVSFKKGTAGLGQVPCEVIGPWIMVAVWVVRIGERGVDGGAGVVLDALRAVEDIGLREIG